MIDKTIPAVVLGMFETGLGVARSLGRAGISIYGLDFKKDIGWYSKYVKATLCPHPLKEENNFISFLQNFSKRLPQKAVIFITSDDFLISVSRNQEKLKDFFLFNLPKYSLIETIANKYRQYLMALKVGIDVPETRVMKDLEDFDAVSTELSYPILIKAVEVNEWRRVVSGTIKGFVIKNKQEFAKIGKPLLEKGIKLLVQEIIKGPDTNHYKFCGYFSQPGEMLLGFTLRKIRQNPIHFGVGAVVESVEYPELVELGRKLFEGIGYCGVGSAEFKVDELDGKLKLIEINPRYWQQNFLATACGMNFPLIDYLEATGQKPEPIHNFKVGIKWVNRYMDLDSFLRYRKEGTLNFSGWRKSLKGEKVYSDYTWADPIPVLYEIGFGWKLIKAPWFIIKRILK